MRPRVGRFQPWIPRKRPLVEGEVIERLGVVGAEPVAPLVAGPPELRRPRLRLEFARVGPKTEIAAAEGRLFTRRHRRDRRVAAHAPVTVGAVHPAIEPGLEPVDTVLLVPLRKAGEERLAEVGPAVAVGVFRIEDFGGAGDEHALPPRQHTGGKPKAVEEQGGGVVAAVAVGVL